MTVSHNATYSTIKFTGRIDSEMENQILSAVPDVEKKAVKTKIDQIRSVQQDYGQFWCPSTSLL
jgi:hypothetical protein